MDKLDWFFTALSVLIVSTVKRREDMPIGEARRCAYCLTWKYPGEVHYCTKQVHEDDAYVNGYYQHQEQFTPEERRELRRMEEHDDKTEHEREMDKQNEGEDVTLNDVCAGFIKDLEGRGWW